MTKRHKWISTDSLSNVEHCQDCSVQRMLVDPPGKHTVKGVYHYCVPPLRSFAKREKVPECRPAPRRKKPERNKVDIILGNDVVPGSVEVMLDGKVTKYPLPKTIEKNEKRTTTRYLTIRLEPASCFVEEVEILKGMMCRLGGVAEVIESQTLGELARHRR